MEGDSKKIEAIKATDEWYDALQSMPFKSSRLFFALQFIKYILIGKNGKTLYLLEQTAKASTKRKKRAVVPLLGTI